MRREITEAPTGDVAALADWLDEHGVVHDDWEAGAIHSLLAELRSDEQRSLHRVGYRRRWLESAPKGAPVLRVPAVMVFIEKDIEGRLHRLVRGGDRAPSEHDCTVGTDLAIGETFKRAARRLLRDELAIEQRVVPRPRQRQPAPRPPRPSSEYPGLLIAHSRVVAFDVDLPRYQKQSYSRSPKPLWGGDTPPGGTFKWMPV